MDAQIFDDVETRPKKVNTIFLDFLLFVRKTIDYLMNFLSSLTNVSQVHQPQIGPQKNQKHQSLKVRVLILAHILTFYLLRRFQLRL